MQPGSLLFSGLTLGRLSSIPVAFPKETFVLEYQANSKHNIKRMNKNDSGKAHTGSVTGKTRYNLALHTTLVLDFASLTLLFSSPTQELPAIEASQCTMFRLQGQLSFAAVRDRHLTCGPYLFGVHVGIT